MSNLIWLSDAQMRRIEGIPRGLTVLRVDVRRIVSGIIREQELATVARRAPGMVLTRRSTTAIRWSPSA